MYDREAEFRGAFYYMKRFSKGVTLPSYTRGFSAGNADKEPGKIVYEHILKLGEDKSLNFEERVNQLQDFLEKTDENQRQENRKKGLMGSPFYENFLRYIKISKKQIENGEPVQKKRP